MARTRSLANLRSDVCYLADISDGGTTGRHTTANLNRRINQAIQAFTRLVTEKGSPTYLKQAAVNTATSSTVDAANWAPRDYLALPSDFYHLIGVDLTTGGSTITLQDFMTLERNMYRDAPSWLTSNGVGMPEAYLLGGSNAAGSRVLKVIPSADAVYACVIWYLPVPADLVVDGDTFDGIAGFEDWVVNRVVMDALSRDVASQAYVTAQAENAKMESDMAFQFAGAAGAGRKVDARAIRARNSRFSRDGWFR